VNSVAVGMKGAGASKQPVKVTPCVATDAQQ
jgi:hypothetical protein